MCFAFRSRVYFGGSSSLGLTFQVGCVRSRMLIFGVPVLGYIWGFLEQSQVDAERAWLGSVLISCTVSQLASSFVGQSRAAAS